jgi:hypothetical protein
MVGADIFQDDEDILNLGKHIDYLLNVEGEYMNQKIKYFFEEIMAEVFRVEAKRYAANPAKWGACCKYPYDEDELPF